MSDERYMALYRKYRPQTFEDVCGRDAVVQTLRNQINHNRIGHSYLFCGTRGTGKTTIAKIFARAVNCEHPSDGNPCGECSCCRAIAADANLNVVEMDAASNNGVDDVRAIIEQVDYTPTQGRYRVFIIDEAHMLSSAAFNALLKTLEEPPSYAIFILCTTEPNKLPVTILSRCQRYDYGRMTQQTIAARLQTVCEREGIRAEDKAIRYIAAAADGSMRDGLSILDQCNAFNYGADILTYEKTLEILGAVDSGVFSGLFRCVHIGDARGALEILDKILMQGRELTQFIADFLSYLRNVMLLKASEETAAMLDVSDESLRSMLEDARSAELNEVIRYINVFSNLTEQIRYSANRRILTEAAIVRLCEPSMDISRDTQTKILSLENRIRLLEDRLAAGAVLQPARAAADISDGMAGPAEPQAQMLRTDSAAEAAPAGAEAADGRGSDARGGAGELRPQLPAAMSEDLQKVAANWDRLIASIPAEDHFLKICLQKAHPTVTKSGELLVVFEGFLEADCFMGRDREEERRFLKEYLSACVGEEIPIRYKYLDKGSKFSDNYVDIRASVNAGAVQMEIEEDDT